MLNVANDPSCDYAAFVTGMHLQKEFGETHLEFDSLSIPTYKFSNGGSEASMAEHLSKTIMGLEKVIGIWNPTHLVIHGDRVEALAAASVGALHNVVTIHIEGGELSGTVDESVRHAITKLAHIHLVSNALAAKRVAQLGEPIENIHVIGSPELDAFSSKDLPSVDEVKRRYQIEFEDYGVSLYHPVTTELKLTRKKAELFYSALERSSKKYVIIQGNNDSGSKAIRQLESKLPRESFRVLPSMRFEFFASLLKNASLLIGNSSSGVRESPFLGVPSVNVGTRQNGRNPSSSSVYNVEEDIVNLLGGIDFQWGKKYVPDPLFGDGQAGTRFSDLMKSGRFELGSLQKKFIDAQ